MPAELGKLHYSAPIEIPRLDFAQTGPHLLAQMRCLSPEEEITRIRPRHFHEIEARVHLNTDAFKRHQSAHNEAEGAGRCNRIFINYISQLVGELFEVHFSEVQIDLALEHIFHKRAELGHIELSMEKAERNEIIYKSAEIALE